MAKAKIKKIEYKPKFKDVVEVVDKESAYYKAEGIVLGGGMYPGTTKVRFSVNCSSFYDKDFNNTSLLRRNYE